MIDACAASVPCGALLALVAPMTVLCVLGIAEWLIERLERDEPTLDFDPWDKRCADDPECLRERNHQGLCDVQEYD